jgi:hypothetical protein
MNREKALKIPPKNSARHLLTKAPPDVKNVLIDPAVPSRKGFIEYTE